MLDDDAGRNTERASGNEFGINIDPSVARFRAYATVDGNRYTADDTTGLLGDEP